MKRTLSILLVLAFALQPLTALAAEDASNGDWNAKTTVLRNTAEAELMVRSGDIDALNDPNAIANGNARIPTLKPAHKSAVKVERLYPFKQSNNLGRNENLT